MKISKIDPLLSQVVKETSLPPEVVAHVISYTLQYANQYVNSPHTKGGLRLPY